MDSLPSKCVVYGLNDRSARRRLGERRIVSPRGGGNWDSGVVHIGDGLFFDFAFELLSPGGAVFGPPVDDGPGIFTGPDPTLR